MSRRLGGVVAYRKLSLPSCPSSSGLGVLKEESVVSPARSHPGQATFLTCSGWVLPVHFRHFVPTFRTSRTSAQTSITFIIPGVRFILEEWRRGLQSDSSVHRQTSPVPRATASIFPTSPFLSRNDSTYPCIARISWHPGNNGLTCAELIYIARTSSHCSAFKNHAMFYDTTAYR